MGELDLLVSCLILALVTRRRGNLGRGLVPIVLGVWEDGGQVSKRGRVIEP
jgi:hypothetical protein